MTQVYVNDSEDTPLETVFNYPVGLEVALHSIKVEFQDLDDPTKKCFAETEIKENEVAQEMFDDAVASGTKGVVLNSYASVRKRGMQSIKIGNFPQRTKVILTCSMMKQLPVEDEGFCFRLPLTYIPQYLFGNGAQEDET